MSIKYLIFLAGIVSCMFIQKNEDLIGIKAKAVFPEIDYKTGKLIKYDTTEVKKFYNDDIVLFKFQYLYNSTSSKLSKSEIRSHYFVYHRGDKYGYDYDKYKSNLGKKMSVDSMFQNEWSMKNNLYPIFGKENQVELISSYQSKNSDTLKESFIIKSKLFQNQSGSVFLEYCKSLGNIDFTFSKELDSIKNMKLYKVKIAMDPLKYNDTLTFDRFETYYEMQPVTNSDKEEILVYINKFKIDKNK